MTARVRPATPDDVESVVAVHEGAFPSQLTTLLGRPVLRHYYGRAFDPLSTMVLLVGEVDHAVVGFAAALISPQTFYRDYRCRWATVLRLALPSLLKSPRALRRVVGAWLRARDATCADGPDVELASIAVSAEFRGQGVGADLIEAVRRHAPPGVGALYAWTDADGNDATLRFYERLGFKPGDARSFDGRRRLARLTLKLDPLRQEATRP